MRLPWPIELVPGGNPAIRGAMEHSFPPPLPLVPPRPVMCRMALVSFVLSIIGGLFFALPSVAGVVIGHQCRRRIRRSAGGLEGMGFATAGVVIGYVIIAIWFGFFMLAATMPGFLRAMKGHSDEVVSRRMLNERKAFRTKLTRQSREDFPAGEPDAASGMVRVDYPGPLGPMAAYVSKDPGDGKKRPAIIWLVGGFDNSISPSMLERGTPDNDQSASAFREAGLLVMYPSLRGGNQNPGFKEAFLGEVDDVAAAFAWLREQPFVDGSRIYLGGHSTGGTLALLVAAAVPELRGVVAFGPVHDVGLYGQSNLPFDVDQKAECDQRSPSKFVRIIRPPTVVIEGVDGNVGSLWMLRTFGGNPRVKYFEIAGADHFEILRPLSEVLAKALLADTGTKPEIRVDRAGLDAAMARQKAR